VVDRALRIVDPALHPDLADARRVAAADHRPAFAERILAFEPRIAGDAFLRGAALRVVHRLFVRTGLDAGAVAAAAMLIDQHDAVFLALVDRLVRARRQARRVGALIADPRQIEEERLVLRQFGAARRDAVLDLRIRARRVL